VTKTNKDCIMLYTLHEKKFVMGLDAITY
jgi:hypothetical protein